MTDSFLDPRIVRMPELASAAWLNTERPLVREQLLGRVVLLDFWDYTCVNCLRTLPYLVAWYHRYTALGLQIVGIHAPEFGFARHHAHIEKAIIENHIPYPVLLDNEYRNWDLFTVKAWPTKILVDVDGYLRLERTGEGHYGEVEQAIQTLLMESGCPGPLPELLAPVRPEDAAGAVCYRPTAEVYAGVRGGGLFAGGLGNPEGFATQGPAYYKLPPKEERREGSFYLGGLWRAWPEAMAYAGETSGQVTLAYSAASVNAVLSPSADPVDTILNLIPDSPPPLVLVRQDGCFLSEEQAGADIVYDERKRSFVNVTSPRMYELVRNPVFGTHELEMTYLKNGLALYCFSFSGCLAPPDSMAGENTYTVQ